QHKEWYLQFRHSHESRLSEAVKHILEDEHVGKEVVTSAAKAVDKNFKQKLLIERILVDRDLLANEFLKKSIYKQALASIRAELDGNKLYVIMSTSSVASHIPGQIPHLKA